MFRFSLFHDYFDIIQFDIGARIPSIDKSGSLNKEAFKFQTF